MSGKLKTRQKCTATSMRERQHIYNSPKMYSKLTWAKCALVKDVCAASQCSYGTSEEAESGSIHRSENKEIYMARSASKKSK
mmetsp:Transcript_8323/g.14563  ORF Transcript_8323/g.14563 Transcript_8323/m.14563 type:complete len:82 (+) Transcript_8323:243-488(+)